MADLAFLDPVGGEFAGLDVLQDGFQLLARFVGDDAGAGDVGAVFGRVRDRVQHGADAAFIDQVDDRKRPVNLSITHISCADFDTDLDVGEA